MNIDYKSDLYHNYMIIEQNFDKKLDHYSIKMISYQDIHGILKMEQRNIDHKVYYYYDIGGKTAIKNLDVNGMFSYDNVKQIMLGILKTIELIGEFLLVESDLYINEETIYIDNDRREVYLTYLPGININVKEQITRFVEYLMNHIDYKDQEAVLLIYDIYAIIKGDFNLLSITQRLKKTKKKDENMNDDKDINSMKYSEERYKKEEVIREKISKEETAPRQLFRKIPIIEIDSWKQYLYSGISVIIAILVLMISFKSKIIFNHFGTKVDGSKFLILLFIIIVGLAVSNIKIWKMENHITKVIKVNDDTKYEPINLSKENKIFVEENDNITCLLSGSIEKQLEYILEPLEEFYEPIRINKFPFSIGKIHGQVDYYLDDRAISRYHAKIDESEGRFFITDLNSTSGTRANKSLLEPYNKTELKLGDEISFGNLIYKFIEV